MAIRIEKPVKSKETTAKIEKNSPILLTAGTKLPDKPKVPALLPLVSLREGVVFPHTETVLVFGRAHSQLAIEAAQKSHNHIVVSAQKKPNVEHPQPYHLYQIGTLCRIERTLQHEGEVHVLLRGLRRVRIESYEQVEPFHIVIAKEVVEKVEQNDELEASLKHLGNLFRNTVQAGKPVDFFQFMRLMGGVRSIELIDHIASTLDIATRDKQRILEELDVNKRVKMVIGTLTHEEHILNIEQKISTETKKQIDDRMRENILRERMQAIQKELGEIDGDEDDLDELDERLKKSKMPADIEKKVAKEMARLRQMSPMHAEYSYLLTWVETMLDIPWNKKSRERTSLKRAARVLDDAHYGLSKVKERVLEHLAVMRLQEKNTEKRAPRDGAGKKSNKPAKKLSTILCFVGPPGVGKTSIGRSIAEALGREFVKVSLGGVHDEAEIRGHRRTYVGAMPGRIIQGLITAKTKNPVFMLDEIDKLGADFRGDPSAAMLEILDPEQNHAYSDHYLSVPYDLSDVMFITTANVLHTIPAPLRDRLEIVEYAGYTPEEKFHIAKQYLLKQVTEGSGLKKHQIDISDSALDFIISMYTREAGVRQLKRELAKIARKVAYKMENDGEKNIKVTKRNVNDFLGPEIFLDTEREAQDRIGLVNGLAWTSVGGEILQIEAALSESSKQGFTLTGQLGDVMQESAKAAFTYVRSHAKDLKIDPKKFEKSHIHVHLPEGATPKDGPSAGVALTVVIASIFTNSAVRRDVAMTGEVTLRGRVLPIGGLKEKLIAAHRAQMKTVYIPKQNLKDLVDIPEEVKKSVQIVPVEDALEVIKAVLAP